MEAGAVWVSIMVGIVLLALALLGLALLMRRRPGGR